MRKTTILASLLTSLFISSSLTAEDKIENIDQSPTLEKETIALEKEDKMSVRDRISLKLEEKKRLRKTADRRALSDESDLALYYIEELKYEDKVKALLRESAFYFDFLIENHDDYEKIKTEADNIGFNAICVAKHLNESEFFVVYESISSFKMDTEENEKKFAEGNENLMKVYQNHPSKHHTQEEIDIRCTEVYK